VLTAAPSIEEEQTENGIGEIGETGKVGELGIGELGIGQIGDGGILKALKDLEWEVSEILTEKVKNIYLSFAQQHFNIGFSFCAFYTETLLTLCLKSLSSHSQMRKGSIAHEKNCLKLFSLQNCKPM
jgi:hypothetical protein